MWRILRLWPSVSFVTTANKLVLLALLLTEVATKKALMFTILSGCAIVAALKWAHTIKHKPKLLT